MPSAGDTADAMLTVTSLDGRQVYCDLRDEHPSTHALPSLHSRKGRLLSRPILELLEEVESEAVAQALQETGRPDTDDPSKVWLFVAAALIPAALEAFWGVAKAINW